MTVTTMTVMVKVITTGKITKTIWVVVTTAISILPRAKPTAMSRPRTSTASKYCWASKETVKVITRQLMIAKPKYEDSRNFAIRSLKANYQENAREALNRDDFPFHNLTRN